MTRSCRREFLTQAGSVGVLALAGIPPAWSQRIAAAERRQEDRILVMVQLAGGNDGLNTVVPFRQDEYYRARPGIAIGKGATLQLDDELGLHPAMTGLKSLFDEGQLGVVQGVGYPHPDRSHFRSTDIWHTALPESQDIDRGWLGRALDLEAEQNQGRVPALALGTERLPLALVGSRVSIPTIGSLEDYKLRSKDGGKLTDEQRHTLLRLTEPQQTGNDELEFLRATARTAIATSKRIESVTESYAPAAEYPGHALAQQLKTIAQLISGGLGASIYFVSLGGFDTHAQQEGAHQALLTELASSVHAFISDLKGHDLLDRVLLMTYSEFGRRVQENGSLGTDHGAASQMFLAGGGVQAGVHGAHPSLTDLDQGDLRYHTDFRSVYATILERWLGMQAAEVLGGEFPLLEIVS